MTRLRHLRVLRMCGGSLWAGELRRILDGGRYDRTALRRGLSYAIPRRCPGGIVFDGIGVGVFWSDPADSRPPVPTTPQLGDRVDSVFGEEHRGTIVGIRYDADGDGIPAMYRVRRDSDGFVWVGLPGTIRPV